MNESLIEGMDPDPTLQVCAAALPAGLWHSFNPGAWPLANKQPCLLVRWLFCHPEAVNPPETCPGLRVSCKQTSFFFPLLFISPFHKNKCDKARKESGAGMQAGG